MLAKTYFVVILLICLSKITSQFDDEEEREIIINNEDDSTYVHVPIRRDMDADLPNVDESESLLSNVVSDVNKTLTNIYNHVTSANVTAENSTQTASENRKLAKCRALTSEVEEIDQTVEIINGSRLTKLLHVNAEVTSRDVEADCVLVMFYTKSCPFSAHAAPHFNALARSYPHVKLVAIDAHHSINALYGIVGVPTLKMFHNGRPVGKFNGTEYNIHSFSKFVNAITGLTPQELLVTVKDFHGPVSSVVEKETDYLLVLSWLFIIVCSVYYFMTSKWWKMIVETIQNNWRESEAQHEHND